MSVEQAESVLSYELQDGGHHPSVFEYAADGVCPVRRVPGSDNDAQLYILNDWKSVVKALKNEKLRSLRQVDIDAAVGGVTLQHQDGLLRRDPPNTDIRRVINPFFSAGATEPWRALMTEVARTHATRISSIDGVFDLATEFCLPLIEDVVTAATGIESGEWERFNSLSDGTTGQLVTKPEDHARIKQAWSDLYGFCDLQIKRIRKQREAGNESGSIMAKVIAALDDAGLSEDEVLRAGTTVYNGFPTVVPAVKVAAQQLLLHRNVLDQHKEDPELWSKVVRELLRHRAHFSFGLPGKVLEDTSINGQTIPKGATVLPAIHAAEYDPTRTYNPESFDITRTSSSLVAFGVGVHVCPGKAFALVLLEEGLKALIDINPTLHLAVNEDEIEWQTGTMPSPKAIPVATT